MWKKKPKINNQVDAGAISAADVHEDLIIHNMPNPGQASNQPSLRSTSQGFGLNSQPPHQFKMAGILIIAGGATLIGLLVVLSYYFIIRPAMSPAPLVSSPSLDSAAPAPDLDSVMAEVSWSVDDSSLDLIEPTDLLAGDPLLVDMSEADKILLESEDQAGPSGPVAVDSDGDGLNDWEEAVFGTDPLNPDTDGDGYSDAVELLAGYNPLGPGLAGPDILAQARNNIFNYRMSYPAAWSLNSLNNDLAFIINLPDESLIQVIAQENYNRLPILSWYQDSFPGASLSYDDLRRGTDWEGIMSADGANFYLTDDNYQTILVISYISASGRIDYPFIFSLIINSVTFE